MYVCMTSPARTTYENVSLNFAHFHLKSISLNCIFHADYLQKGSVVNCVYNLHKPFITTNRIIAQVLLLPTLLKTTSVSASHARQSEQATDDCTRANQLLAGGRLPGSVQLRLSSSTFTCSGTAV
jgi:hypothetical protein